MVSVARHLQGQGLMAVPVQVPNNYCYAVVYWWTTVCGKCFCFAIFCSPTASLDSGKKVSQTTGVHSGIYLVFKWCFLHLSILKYDFGSPSKYVIGKLDIWQMWKPETSCLCKAVSWGEIWTTLTQTSVTTERQLNCG